MFKKKIYTFDLEADELYRKVTKIHCLSYCDLETGEITTLTDYKEIKEFVCQKDIVIIGHMITIYDIPVLEKLLDIKVTCDRIDTLPLSWVIDVSRKIHGLESYGHDFGVEKPKISDWTNLSSEDYIHRCQEDVKINTFLWKKQLRYLRMLYRDDEENLVRYLNYLRFKMECVLEQELNGLKLDVDLAKKHFEELTEEKRKKRDELLAAMPKAEKIKKAVYKDAVEDSNGNIFQKGDLFFNAFAENGKKTIEKSKVVGHKDANPNSVVQLKNWLYSLGWVPENIQHKRDKKTGEVKKIPQIKSQFEAGEVCASVKKLFKKEPKLEVLGGLAVLSHRIGLFDGMLKEQIDGRLYPSMMGLTNTLRLQHRVIVNLPSVDKKYGKEVRECIIADEGHILCGSDLSNIEDRTKRHYIYKYDPKYVEDMNTPGYDAHLEIAVLASFITVDDMEFYKEIERKKDLDKNYVLTSEEKARFSKLKPIRTKSKITNFSATYKVGAESLARNSGMKPKEAKKLLRIYWERNAAILKVEDSLKIKEIEGQRWLFNPVSKFWYSLRADKDKFSTLNQGTAVFCFDLFIYFLRKLGLIIPFQYHDEIMCNVKEGEEDKVSQTIKKAIKLVNQKLKLNIQVGAGTQFGPNYAEIH